MRIILACDSYGAPLAQVVAEHLQTRPGIDIADRGTYEKYYEAAHQVAREVDEAAASGRTDVRAVLCCGSGQVRVRELLPPGRSACAQLLPGITYVVL